MRSQQIECSFIEMKNNKIQNQKLEGRFSLRLNLPQLRRSTVNNNIESTSGWLSDLF